MIFDGKKGGCGSCGYKGGEDDEKGGCCGGDCDCK